MKCKLCGKEETLLRKSHIIPDFLYQDLYDEIHRYHEVKLKNESPLKSKTRQSGAYEPDILCKTCDNKIFGGLETYASQALYGGIELTIENGAINSSKYIRIKGLDYLKFKLFLLSVWWRASISSLPIFHDVNLGDHEKIIREKLLTNDPGSSEEYPCAIFTYLHHKNEYHPIIAEPKSNTTNGQQICAFLIGGNLFLFFSHLDEKTDWVRQSAINEQGMMQIVQMSENLSSKVVNKFLGMDLL